MHVIRSTANQDTVRKDLFNCGAGSRDSESSIKNESGPKRFVFAVRRFFIPFCNWGG